VVADLVAPPRRATAYGVFAAGLGAATAAGGALTGWLSSLAVGLAAAFAGVALGRLL
jgi:predicted MFS family arabinose efflux permease